MVSSGIVNMTFVRCPKRHRSVSNRDDRKRRRRSQAIQLELDLVLRHQHKPDAVAFLKSWWHGEWVLFLENRMAVLNSQQAICKNIKPTCEHVLRISSKYPNGQSNQRNGTCCVMFQGGLTTAFTRKRPHVAIVGRIVGNNALVRDLDRYKPFGTRTAAPLPVTAIESPLVVLAKSVSPCRITSTTVPTSSVRLFIVRRL